MTSRLYKKYFSILGKNAISILSFLFFFNTHVKECNNKVLWTVILWWNDSIITLISKRLQSRFNFFFFIFKNYRRQFWLIWRFQCYYSIVENVVFQLLLSWKPILMHDSQKLNIATIFINAWIQLKNSDNLIKLIKFEMKQKLLQKIMNQCKRTKSKYLFIHFCSFEIVIQITICS